ncbi:hypothetical protein MNEG_5497 [Monoraphidium neglectum]|uniref:SAP domain-containing protein n=1 Tax=Monoraphidium neglectum TaxID=145388 RepID=A0A0D2JU86_9CHLO|nr:hypothetical protein MNEG_5497 [Monoraphidium neglectum]KIZ02463.1 hypothetical protein MNEG_5497 [Monoraphidium neglectum]|eukprot:XP_013901482.1 hypothetical protein MNEG_5497 [Monoraphidium neglectum]
MATREELEAKKVPELKEECQQLGLPVTGKKAELIDRILAAQGSSAAEADAAEPAEAAAAPANGSAHSSGKHQRIEFNLAAAEPAVAPAAAAAPSSKIIKLGGEDEAPKAVAAEAPEAPAPHGDIESVAVLSAEERKRLRGEKFGLSEDDKKKKRAARFGLPDAEADDEKKKQRRERFGITTKDDEKAALVAKKAELLDPTKLKARAERFGVAKGSALASAEDEAKKKARAERFKAAQ